MSTLRRIVLVRHGETDGQSSIRFFGSTDVPLSAAGREQMIAAARSLKREPFQGRVTSPLRRAWQSAWIVGRGAPIHLDPDFREIHFGRWEGLTKEEIEASDPVRFQDWQAGAEHFEYPGGEARSEFRARVEGGLQRLLASPIRSALVVAHKGVIRAIVETLTGESLDRDAPALGGTIPLTRDGDGSWFRGCHSSNPPGVV